MSSCEHCTEGFKPKVRTQRFCSRRCQRAAEKRRYRERHSVPAVCPHCGLRFQTSTVDGRRKVYCSTSCQYQARSSEYRQRDDIGRPKVIGPYCEALRADPCAYCGEPSEDIDHIEARSKGGANHWENYAGICRRCNSSKGDKSMLGFMAWRRAAVEFDAWRVFNGRDADDLAKSRASEARGVGTDSSFRHSKTAGVALRARLASQPEGISENGSQ